MKKSVYFKDDDRYVLDLTDEQIERVMINRIAYINFFLALAFFILYFFTEFNKEWIQIFLVTLILIDFWFWFYWDLAFESINFIDESELE